MSTEESWKIALQFVSVVSGLIAIILTIPVIRQRLLGPRLSVKLVGDLGVRTKRLQDGIEIPMYMYHLRVSNARGKWAPAENVKVLVKSLSKGADPHFYTMRITGDIPLAWEHTEKTPESRKIGKDHICDLGYLEPPGFRLKTYFDPNDFENRLKGGETMLVEIQAVADSGAASKSLWLKIYWTGVWPDDSGDIRKHVFVNEIAPGSQNRTS